MSIFLNMDLPVEYSAWVVAEHESDAEAKSFFATIKKEWGVPLPDEWQRVSLVLKNYKNHSEEWEMLSALTYAGEKIQALDQYWLIAVMAILLRRKLQAGGDVQDEDILLLRELAPLFNYGEVNIDWHEWSSDKRWTKQPIPKDEYDLKKYSAARTAWMAVQKKRLRNEAVVPEYAVKEITEKAHIEGMPESVSRYISIIRNLWTIIG